jgi:hypothetical protein
MIRRLAVFFLFVCVTTTALGQNAPAPSGAIPTPDELLGYKLGDRFTPWDHILGYFTELTKRSNLISVDQFGQTYEGRPLVLATITSAKNRAALDQIRRDVASLASADVDPARAAQIAKNTPAIVWLAFGVHGNESSSAEAAMRVASTLLRDPDSASILDNVVVVIDPLQNPDGRERYVQWFTRTRGAEANPNSEAFEHAEPWPGGRYNHYLTDMNRDWAWTSQQETQARVTLYRLWNPQVVVDFHEMGTNSTYFFPPDAKPINVNLPKDVEHWLEVFGRANAEAFSKRGWPFFVNEEFDLFYPAYGDSWPALHGAIGMTYEVAGGGRGGTAVEREDGAVLLLAHRIDEHYTTGMATLRTASQNREALLGYTYTAARTQIDNGKNSYLVLPGSPNFEPLMELMQRQAVKVGILSAPVTAKATRVDSEIAENKTFPAGTAVISTKQALGRLVETLFEKSPTFSKGYLEEQRTKTSADESDDFYDLTSWSLPLAMNVETFVTNVPLTAEMRPYERPAPPAMRPATYGYLVEANEPNLYRAAGRMLAAKINFSVTEDELVAGERTFPRGSIVILKGSNKPDLDAALGRIAGETGVTAHPIDSGWIGTTALGSNRIHYIKDPQIGLFGGPGTDATSYGAIWHTLDIEVPTPHTNLSLESFRNLDLSHYRVLIFPDGGSYTDRLGKKGIEKLQEWVRSGGTIVAVKGGSAFLREKDVDLSKVKPWEAPKKKDDDKTTAEERYNEFRVPGSAFRTVMSERSYLTFGVPRPPAVLIEGTAALQPLSHKVDNIVTIDAKNPLVSGVAWPESLDRLKGAVYLTAEPYGRGTVITFADEPNYRLFWRGTLPLFMNAVLYSPSFPR